MRTSFLSAVVCIAIAACRDRAPAPAAEPPAAVAATEAARGTRAIAALKQRLMGALTAAMKTGTPAAIAVCNTEAPAIAHDLRADGVIVGRATRKPRNPANAVAGWQADALASFEAKVRAGEPLEGAHWTRRLPDGRTAYAEPLVIQPVCLACHGTALEPAVRDALAATYPGDQATGYVAGELRGVAWAELSAAPAR